MAGKAPPAATPGITTAELARAGIHLDPAEAAAARAANAHDANTVAFPALRVAAFSLLSALVLLHVAAFPETGSLRGALIFATATLTYSLLAWGALRQWFRYRDGRVDLGDVFFGTDLLVLGGAVLATGGPESWLFFLPLFRVADQVYAGPRRAYLFAHLATATYLLVIVIASLAGPVAWLPELAKLLFLYIGGLYIARAAAPAAKIRAQRALTSRFAAEMIRKLEARTIELAHQTRQAQRLREEAEEASRAQARLLSRVSHEFRTPLNHILGFSQLLELGGLRRDQEENVREVQNAGRRLLALVDQVLRITGGGLQEEDVIAERVDVAAIIRRALAQLKPVIEAREITVAFGGDASESAIAYTSHRHLEQALWRLLSNAVKHNRHGGRIDITIAEMDDRIHVGITDTGQGIPEDRLPLLFEPFGQLGDANANGDREDGGSGLATARALINAIGGQLRATSQPGHGSTFYFDVPAVVDVLTRVD